MVVKYGALKIAKLLKIYIEDPFKIIKKTFTCSLSIIEFSNFDNLDSFQLTIYVK